MPDSPRPLGERVRLGWTRADRFIKRDLWLSLPDKAGLRILWRLLRMGVLVTEGFIRSEVFLLSAALTYQVIFALVPLLVVMLAAFKGFGGLSKLGHDVQAFIIRNVTPQVTGDLQTRIDSFVNNVNATAIGIVGFAALLYTSLSLLATIESAFNKIWGIKSGRSLLRRFTVYWTFLTVTPILLAASLSMTSFVTSNAGYGWLSRNVPFFGKATMVVTPFVVAWVMFTGFYVFMPNTRVKIGAAFMGALFAGTAWEGMKGVYFWYNTHVVTNYAFYGSLGSIPVFLLWIYLSWIIVLFGAEVAFAAQHLNTYRREIEQVRVSAADREALALVVGVGVARPFLRGQTPPVGEDIAAWINAPVRVVNEVLFQLTAQGILREVALPHRKEPGFIPARDLTSLTAADVVTAVRSYGDPFTPPDGHEALEIFRLVDRAEERGVESLAGVTLKDLADREGPQARPAPTSPSVPPATQNA